MLWAFPHGSLSDISSPQRRRRRLGQPSAWRIKKAEARRGHVQAAGGHGLLRRVSRGKWLLRRKHRSGPKAPSLTPNAHLPEQPGQLPP
ncbi:hypothetical protein HPB48_007157 [Haemaphysalis longicornis]|uniref:Uncharacterized protein n=1 Tax=Haemaphysalis longicornis TaxID=44386 RepID=A0A9J6FAK8_HAELO|nr:hypothetical protein HPB48_007157 [Haemaphysalis longicornis]